jgi:hypothetical protein
VEDNNETFAAPKEVRDKASFDWKFHGRFTVCPVERAVAGRMQTVCIESATRLAKSTSDKSGK